MDIDVHQPVPGRLQQHLANWESYGVAGMKQHRTQPTKESAKMSVTIKPLSPYVLPLFSKLNGKLIQILRENNALGTIPTYNVKNDEMIKANVAAFKKNTDNTFSENLINFYRPQNEQLVKYEGMPILKGAKVWITLNCVAYMGNFNCITSNMDRNIIIVGPM